MILNIRKKPLQCLALFIGVLVCLIAGFPLRAGGGEFSGLWAGAATINGVSQVNTSTPDLAFDLGLSGLKETQTLLLKSDAGWSVNTMDAFSNLDWTTGADTAANWSDNNTAPFHGILAGASIADNQQFATYFRNSFQVGDRSSFKDLTLRVWATGGIQVYLNGANLLMENLTGPGHNGVALSDSDDIRFYEIELPLSALYQNSANTLAAAVHSFDRNQSSVYFNLELTARTQTNTDFPLIAKGAATWTSHATGADPGPDWHSQGYDDTAWSPGGSTPFYLFRKGTSTGAHVQTTYFRKRIQIADASLFTALHLNVWRDDGAIVYLNGVEIFRSNMPLGSVAHDSPALCEILSQRLAGKRVENGVLQTGENWLAVETHSSGNNDNELYFDLELTAAVEEILIPVKAMGWKFTPTTSTPEPYQAPAPDPPDITWTQPAYNVAGWGEGQAVIGFGDGEETTQTQIGYNTAIWPRTIYFRHLFNPETQGFDYLRVQLLRDDGAVVYLNGVEVLRSNMPAGVIDYQSAPVSAIGPSGEGQYIVKQIDLDLYEDLLVAGENAVAVEIHQHSSETGGPQAPQTAVTPTPASFNLRLLLHSDAAGKARLLKEVYQMYRKQGDQSIPVLLSNDLRIPDFVGPGWRLSTIGLDFEGASIVRDTGAIGPEGTLTFTATLPANHPSNPFLHTFHPDHDNWDARYEKHYPEDYPVDDSSQEESFGVERTITFTFETKYPSGCEGSTCRQYPPPGWGATRIGGTYEEVITGLHKDDITVTGSFSLDRISVIDQLEQ